MGAMSKVLWWPLEAEKDKETNSRNFRGNETLELIP